VEEKDGKKRAEEIALFRFGLIADLKDLPPGTRGLYAKLREKSEQDRFIPGTTRTRVAAETIRDWLQAYRRGGFDALLPRPRSDVGQARRLPKEIIDALVETKEARPALTIKQVIAIARDEGLVPGDLVLPYSTVHRLLARRGLTAADVHPGPGGKDHRRFSFEKAGELWMSDVMHGPVIPSYGSKARRKAYLIAFLDDATRVVPHAAFAHAENTAAFLPVLKTAVSRRGVPSRLFVDNGAAYRSHHLSLVCAKLGITLIHARAYHPEAKGKQERWFRTVRTQLLPLLADADTASLDALNRRLWAYIEGEYHRTPHRGLGGETPLDRWAQRADDVKYVGAGADLDDLFLFEAKRRVHKDRTVSLDGVVYEVDATLVGESVVLRYDPARRGGTVQVWLGGRKVQDAKVLDAYANCFVKRDRPGKTLDAGAPPPQPKSPIRFRADDEEGR